MEGRDDRHYLLSGIFNFKNYDFIQEGTSNPIPAVMNVFEKKLFRFKYRMYNDAPDEHFIRETRMKKRFFDRLKTNDPRKLTDPAKVAHLANTGDMPAALQAAQPYRDYVMSEAVQQYKDYYESDVEDLKDFEVMSPEERASFAKAFTDFSAPVKKYVHPLNEKFGEMSDSDDEGKKTVDGGLGKHLEFMKKELYPKAEAEGVKQALGELHLATPVDESKFRKSFTRITSKKFTELLADSMSKEYERISRPRTDDVPNIDSIKIVTSMGSPKSQA